MTKILLVEDHPELREVLQRQIEWLGFTTIIAKNGKEGVDTAVAEKPDLILMNSMMPEMNGWEATKILRSNPQTKDIPILAAMGNVPARRSKSLVRRRMQRLHRQTIYIG